MRLFWADLNVSGNCLSVIDEQRGRVHPHNSIRISSGKVMDQILIQIPRYKFFLPFEVVWEGKKSYA